MTDFGICVILQSISLSWAFRGPWCCAHLITVMLRGVGLRAPVGNQSISRALVQQMGCLAVFIHLPACLPAVAAAAAPCCVLLFRSIQERNVRKCSEWINLRLRLVFCWLST